MGGELKRCPFCNGRPDLISGGPGNHYVTCDACGCTSDDGSKERVIKAWNRRASPAPPSGSAWGDLLQTAKRGLETAEVVMDTEDDPGSWAIVSHARKAVDAAILSALSPSPSYAEGLEAALRVIAEYPVTDPLNQDAWNMSAIAANALTPAPSYAEGIEADFGGTAVQIVEAILLNLGIGADASREPGVDRRRDRLCRLIEPMLPAPPNVKVAP